MTLGELINHVELKLALVTPSWKAEARTIICHILGITPLDLVIERTKQVNASDIDKVMSIVEARQKRVPLQYSLTYQHFYGLDFHVDEHVLIPRPETEVLVEYVIDQAKQIKGGQEGRILDIGVGSGAIVIALAAHLENYVFVGSDIDADTLSVAEQNAIVHGVSDRIKWIRSDLFENLAHDEKFDMIVSNPPYIPESDKAGLEPEVVDYEPHLALFGGADGLDFYRRIIPEALPYLSDGGMVVFEAGHDQFLEIEDMFKANGYVDVGHFEDLAGIPRFIYGKKAPIGG